MTSTALQSPKNGSPSPKGGAGPRRWLPIVFKLGVSVALVAVLLNAVGAERALAHMTGVDGVWFVAALAVGFFQIVICSERWRGVLDVIGAAIGHKAAFVYWYIGAFFNQTLPSSVGGDVMRGYLAYKDGLGFAPVLSSLVLERLVTVLGLVLLVATMTPFVAHTFTGGAWFAGAVWAALGLALGGVVVLMVLDRLPRGLSRFKVVRGVSVLAGDARALLLSPGPALRVMAWSVLGHVNLSLVAFALIQGLGLEVTLLECLTLFPAVMLLQTIPISLAGWGVREAAAVVLFQLVGVDKDGALALSLLFGVVMALVSLPGVVPWVLSGRRSLKDAEAFAARAEEA